MSMATLNFVSSLLKNSPHLATSDHILLHLIKLYILSLTKNYFKFSTQAPENVIRYCHILSGLMTTAHTLSPIFDRKIMSETTLNSGTRLLKMLLNLASSYHVL